jgi:hypothetical protein
VVIMKIINRQNAKSINGVTFSSEITESLCLLLKSLAMAN